MEYLHFLSILVLPILWIWNMPAHPQLTVSRRMSAPPLVNGLDDAVCLSKQQVNDTFVSTGTHYNPLNGASIANKEVLLLSHGLIQWFDIGTQKSTIAFKMTNARFRGMYSTEINYVFLITPDMKKFSRFLVMNKQFHVLNSVEAVGTMDGHDMVKYGDIVYVVSTGTGSLQVYNADSFELVRSHAIASKADHINTISVSSSCVYVMLHKRNRESSEIIIYDRFSFEPFNRFKDVGWSAHGLSLWNGYIVSLDSIGQNRRGSVVLINKKGIVKPIWTCTDACFLKGLVVIDDTVCFGHSPPQRRMDRLTVDSDIICIELSANTSVNMLYTLSMHTNGLLNQIVHPANTIQTSYTLMQVDKKISTSPPSYRMLGPIDITDTRMFFLKHWEYIWESFQYQEIFKHRHENLFVGVKHLRVLFSFYRGKYDNLDDDTSVELPTAWVFFKPVVIPMLDSLFKRLKITNWETKILRLQFNLIPENAEVRPHTDTGFYAEYAHRIHIPIFGSKCILFQQRMDEEWNEVPFKEGEAFEINNRLRHMVQQFGPYNRVTLIIDYLDEDCGSFGNLTDTLRSTTIQESLNVPKWRGEL